jgi:hypothetical protein
MNALLPKFQTCLVRTHEAGFHPGYWSFVDKQIRVFAYPEYAGCSAKITVNDPAAKLRGIKYKKDSLRFPSPHPSPQRGEGKGEGADSGEKKC